MPLPLLELHGGGRLAAAGANVPRDAASGSPAVTPRWAAAVGRAGAALHAHDRVTVHLNFDQGFRAPNLDDLSSRQQVGPGFQFENSALEPERTNTLELGVQAAPSLLAIEAWAFATWLDGSITRAVRDQGDCPPETDACRASRSQFQLVNAPGSALILGAEGAATREPAVRVVAARDGRLCLGRRTQYGESLGRRRDAVRRAGAALAHPAAQRHGPGPL